MSRQNSLIFIIFLILTIININKAFHIDDTFHLEAAKIIQEDPSNSLKGKINWYGTPEPVSTYNQPILFFAALALFTKYAGFSEIALHLFMSVFVLLSLIGFVKIIRQVKLKNQSLLLILFGLSPALIINQNVMTDIPLLALILYSCYFALKAQRLNKGFNYLLSFLFLSIAVLIKYTVLPFIGALGLIIILRRDFKYLWYCIVPLVTIIIWSIWNYIDYGSIHILDRPKSSFHPKIVTSFLMCLGAISPFSLSYISAIYNGKRINRAMMILVAVLVLLVLLFYLFPLSYLEQKLWFVLAFGLNGCLVLFPIGKSVFNKIMASRKQFINSDLLVIYVYLIAITAFIILFAPFMATRHVLLLLPFLLIAGDELLSKAHIQLNYLVVSLSVVLGVLLGISDWHFANFYREAPKHLHLPENKNVYFTGHWGWQWYAALNNMKQLDISRPQLQTGDYLVCPSNVTSKAQEVLDKFKNKEVQVYTNEAGMATFFYVSNAGLYASGNRNPVWCLLKAPVDTIKVYEIIE